MTSRTSVHCVEYTRGSSIATLKDQSAKTCNVLIVTKSYSAGLDSY